MLDTQPRLIEQVTHPFIIERYMWPNGLTLIYQPDHSAPLLSYQTWFNVGSATEKSGQTGLAHLFEHLMFKGTTRFPEGEFDRLLEEAGAEANAATWLDWTYYYSDIPSKHFERVAELEADRFAHLQLNQAVLDAERLVVMNERRECVDDDPDGLMDELLWLHALGHHHPYGHPTIGWMNDIQKLTLDDCLSFYQSHYVASQVTLVISGDLERGRMLSVIDHHYGALPRVSTQAQVVFPPSRPVENSRIGVELPLHATRVHIAFRIPSIDDPLHLALECLDGLLFGGASAPLYQKLIFDLELASSVYSSLPHFRGDALYDIDIELHTQVDPEEAIQVVLTDLALIASGEFDARELDRVKSFKELDNLRSIQTLQQRANCLGFWSVTTGDMQGMFKRLNQLQFIEQSDLIEAAKLLLEPGRMITLIGSPISDYEKENSIGEE